MYCYIDIHVHESLTFFNAESNMYKINVELIVRCYKLYPTLHKLCFEYDPKISC